jgi:hypothetical protein
VVVVVALLSRRFGSCSFADTVAVFVSVRGVVVVTVIWTLAVAPLPSLPTLQVTVPSFGVAVDRLQVPWLEETELKWRLLGKASLTVTPVALSGPLFVTRSVEVNRSPLTTGFGEAAVTIARSADGAAASKAPMSQPEPCGRVTPRWSVVNCCSGARGRRGNCSHRQREY